MRKKLGLKEIYERGNSEGRTFELRFRCPEHIFKLKKEFSDVHLLRKYLKTHDIVDIEIIEVVV